MSILHHIFDGRHPLKAWRKQRVLSGFYLFYSLMQMMCLTLGSATFFFSSSTNISLWETVAHCVLELMWVVWAGHPCSGVLVCPCPAGPPLRLPVPRCPFRGPAPLNPNNSSICLAKAGNALGRLLAASLPAPLDAKPVDLPRMTALPPLLLPYTPSARVCDWAKWRDGLWDPTLCSTIKEHAQRL